MLGKPIAKQILTDVRAKFLHRRNTQNQSILSMLGNASAMPCLGIIQVGNKYDSNLFIANKKRKCDSLGFKHVHAKLATKSTEGDNNQRNYVSRSSFSTRIRAFMGLFSSCRFRSICSQTLIIS